MTTTVIANRLGDIRAERDTRMLDVAFYETPDYRTLLADSERPIVVGRRGTGKSALFYQLAKYWRLDKSAVVLDIVPHEDQVIGARHFLKAFGQHYNQIKAGARIAWKYALVLEVATLLRDHWKFQSTLGFPILEAHLQQWRKLGTTVCARFRSLLARELQTSDPPETVIGGLSADAQLSLQRIWASRLHHHS